MAGYVSSWIEQYTGTNVPTCGNSAPQSALPSNWLLYVLVGVVILSVKFEKKRSVKK
jgi:hypothetical protein